MPEEKPDLAGLLTQFSDKDLATNPRIKILVRQAVQDMRAFEIHRARIDDERAWAGRKSISEMSLGAQAASRRMKEIAAQYDFPWLNVLLYGYD